MRGLLPAAADEADMAALPVPVLDPDRLSETGRSEPFSEPEFSTLAAYFNYPDPAEGAENPLEVFHEDNGTARPGRRPARPLRITPYHYNQAGAASVRAAPVRRGAISGLDRPLTKEYIARYASPKGIELLNTIIRRGNPYFAFIRKEVEKRNLPPELMYLPIIESAFMPNAVSRAGATGLWQFMKNSIGPYDMQINEWMDERMDFWKSTMGALSKLEENYRELGDWALALAAYNHGLGAVSRAVRRTGVRDYWALSERRQFAAETIHYVPKLLAVSHIISNPRHFNIDPLWPEDPQWTRVKVGRMVDLDLLAAEAGVDKRELKRVNSELRYNVTPPDPDYCLKVRAADADAVKTVLERKDLTLIRYYFHTIGPGETLSELAQHYGVSVDNILSLNPGVQPRYLKLGARLLIPAY
ncbi:MAG: transglycosylase SLT domain-containing protein, partial [Spirochaetaceae bacterium]|nr:transglycosylase SLT domain-containing protein [Spirochaetaceae bacterium]